MLQPIQLKDVSTRYATEIIELRDFLTKAGVPLDTARTLQEVVVRLREDRAFRRDLKSHLWVVLHTSDRQISYPDLLGLLAIAAAGSQFATTADDTDAYDMLRFLMGVKSSFETGPEMRKELPPLRPALSSDQPFQPVEAHVPEPFMRRIHPAYANSLALEMLEGDSGQRPIVWIGSAVCILVVLLAGLWFHHHSVADRGTPAASAAATPPPAVLTKRDTGQLAQQRSETVAPAARRSPRNAPYTTIRESSRDFPEAKNPLQAKPAPGTPMVPIPIAQIAKLLSSPSPLTPPKPSAAQGQNSAKLLQRKASLAKPNNFAKVDSKRIATIGSINEKEAYNRNTNAATEAIVRPTSLGIMAGNVTYSPAPAYPTAASAARVQGEVKLEAEVDRDGNVASTRIISGPPLLRDAAEDAVQHWRYRPYLYDGKPVAMNATVVVDFQLR